MNRPLNNYDDAAARRGSRNKFTQLQLRGGARLGCLIFSIVIIGISLAGVHAQGKEISREEYYAPYREALTRSREFSRRNIQKIRSSWNGKTSEEEWTYEYHLPDRIRYLHIETVDGKSRRTEQINIGKSMYCKKDDGAWSLANSYCIGGSGSGGPSNIIKEVFRREKTKLDGKPSVHYYEHVTYQNTYSKTAGTDGPSFLESQFWIDEKGLIVRYETRRGLVSSKMPSYEQVETYVYDPTIKIEAPIITK